MNKKTVAIAIMALLAASATVVGCVNPFPVSPNFSSSSTQSTADDSSEESSSIESVDSSEEDSSSSAEPVFTHESKFAMSEGIALELDERTGTYTVTGIGTCTDNAIKLSHVYDGKPVTEIAASAFENCRQLTRVEIDNGYEEIGTSAFKNCTNLQQLVLSDGLKVIDSGAFTLCYNLTEVYNDSDLQIEQGKTTNGSVAYYAEKMLEVETEFSEIAVKDDFIYRLGGENPVLCGYLGAEKNLILPESYESAPYIIADYALYNAGLDALHLAESTVDYAFMEKTAFKSLYYPGSLSEWCAVERTELDYNPIKKEGITFYANDVAVEGILSLNFDVKAYAFTGYSKITALTVTKDCKSIGAHAFEKTGLTKVTFEDGGVTAIPDYAFNYCAKLTEVVFSDDITAIGANAFEYAGLTGLTLPSNLQTMGASAFYMLSGLTGTISVPGSLKVIPKQAFGYSKISGVTLNEGLERIEDSAFINCNLETLKIPNTCKYLGLRAFYKNLKLTYVDLGDGVEQIGYNIKHNGELGINTDYTATTFAQCWTLKTVIFGRSIQHVGRFAFSCDQHPDEFQFYYKGTMEEWVALFNNKDEHPEAHIHDQQMRYFIVNPNAYAEVKWRCYSETRPTEAKELTNPNPGTNAQPAQWPWVLKTTEGATQEQIEAAYDNFWCFVDGVPTSWANIE